MNDRDCGEPKPVVTQENRKLRAMIDEGLGWEDMDRDMNPSCPIPEPVVTSQAIELARKAFWWSAEFTAIAHDNNIRSAWEEYKEYYMGALEPKEGET